MSHTSGAKVLEMEIEPARESEIKVLIVDDNAHNLLAFQTTLSDSRYRLVNVNSGREALKCLMDSNFALVLMDVQMPDLDGFETAALIRERELTKRIPIIFITANAPDEINIFKGYSVGAVDYISTPIIPEILRAKVSILVELFMNTEKVKQQAELLRIEERKEHAQKLQEIRQRMELEALSIREESLRREKEIEVRNAERLTTKAHELERANAELRRSNADLEEFAYVSSHDLKEPLRMVALYTQILEAEDCGQLNERGTECVRTMREGVTRMQFLIDSLLLYAEIGKKDEEVVLADCKEVVNQALKNLHVAISESHAKITCGPLPVIAMRPTRITQVFQNLIGNAIKFHGKSPPKIQIESREFDTYHQFSVRDSGIGIKPDYHKKMFDIFQRLNRREEYAGTGIGLSVCRKVVDLHGGRIWVESEEGMGATFHFTLPKLYVP